MTRPTRAACADPAESAACDRAALEQQSPAPELGGEILRGYVERLAGDIGERNVWRPAALHAAAGYIRAQWQALGYAVAAQTYRAHGLDCENLEITIPGATRPREIVLAGAHYDSVLGSPGANDNASGVAALIRIAALLRGLRPARTLKLIAFVNEEPPFFYFGEMGSKLYADAARARGDDIRVMLSLETIGCYSDAAGSQGYPPLLRFFYPERGNFVAFVSNLRSRRALRETVRAFKARSDFPCESLASPAFVPGVSWSDQLSFWRAGYPGVMVTDTAFYRYSYYHSPLDTPEKLSYPELARVVDGVAGALAVLAGPA
jgi:Zn-dependent M28 family amino/carboxypeptidase